MYNNKKMSKEQIVTETYAKIMLYLSSAPQSIRLGQLLDNFVSWCKVSKEQDLFYMDNQKFLECVNEFFGA